MEFSYQQPRLEQLFRSDSIDKIIHCNLIIIYYCVLAKILVLLVELCQLHGVC